MIIHKALLKPAATDVSAELMDADTQVGIVVSWAGCRAAQMFPLEGFSKNRALVWFQAWADEHADVIAHALEVREKRRAAAEAGGVTGKYPEPLEPASQPDAALAAQREAERLDERLDPALQREANSGH
jgi:hypothetical protein